MADIVTIGGRQSKRVLLGASCAFGVFNGVHLGHRFLIDRVRKTAAESGGAAIALTFSIDPDDLFAADRLVKQITVMDPMIDATIGHQAIPVFVYLSEYHPNIEVHLHTISGQTVSEALLDGTVDVGYLMAYGPIEEVVEGRAEQGIVAVPLRRGHFSSWMSKKHPISSKEPLRACSKVMRSSTTSIFISRKQR